MTDYDKRIHSNPDAQAWAKFFITTMKEKEWCIDDIDESLMTGWFANAMMAMHDHVKKEWVGLTDEERKKLADVIRFNNIWYLEDMLRAAEEMLEKKNT